ncbi:MAG: hypothetical protein AB2693_20310 [Candidatus Thiodiazotropha sp.]
MWRLLRYTPTVPAGLAHIELLSCDFDAPSRYCRFSVSERGTIITIQAVPNPWRIEAGSQETGVCLSSAGTASISSCPSNLLY